jgi:zinc transport system substrate-binding protein
VSLVASVVIVLLGCSRDGGDRQSEPDSEDNAFGSKKAADRQSEPDSNDNTFQIYVVNYPLQYMARRIVGDKAKVVFPAPADGDPAYWLPDESTIVAYQNADLILLNGASYAKWLSKVTLPESKMVDTSAGFKKKYIVIEDAITHTHGPEGAHAHGATDFNTWLDPELAIMHAEAIAEAMAGQLPDHNDEFQANLATLRADLESLGQSLKEVTAGYQDQPLLASHPVYSYLARYCGWNLKSMHWEPDQIPDDEEWAKLDALLADHSARWMIWEGVPNADITAKLEDRGIGSVVFAPCGNTPQTGDYMDAMRANISALTPVFEKP